jgi:hypothetical protein
MEHELERGKDGGEEKLTVGVGVAVRSGVGVEVGGTFPSLAAPSRSVGFRGGVATVAVNLVSCAPGPYLLFIGLRDRGPPTRSRLSIPDQDAVKGSELAVGPIRLRSILTLHDENEYDADELQPLCTNLCTK